MIRLLLIWLGIIENRPPKPWLPKTSLMQEWRKLR